MDAHHRFLDAAEHAADAAGFFVCLAAVLSLLLVGCGQEPEPTLVSRHELCAVTLLADGQVACTCEAAQ